MDVNNKKEFKSIIETMFLGFGRQVPQKEVIQLWWNVFERESMEDVRAAFSQAISESTAFLVPGVVRQYIPDRSGFLGAEEAWGIYPKTEQEGAWVYPEILKAGQSCTSALARGDQIGARMAFLEVYRRVAEDAKRRGVQPHWFYSESSGLTQVEADQQKIQRTIEASEKGWISQEKAQSVLLIADQSSPNPKIMQMIQNGNVVKQIPSGSSTEDTPRIALENKT